MSLREWLVLIGILVIVGVVIDGYRRMRLARKRSSELAFGLEEVKGYDDNFSSELPNGGARRQGQGKGQGEQQTSDVTPVVKKHTRKESRKPRSERIEPDFNGMKFGSASEPELNLSATDDFDTSDGIRIQDEPRQSPGREIKPAVEKPVENDIKPESLTTRAEAPEPKPGKTGPASRQSGKEKLSDRPPVDEVVVINILAKGDQVFDGTRMLQSFLSAGLKFGDRSIFHRYSNADGSGHIQFSLANGVKPGFFDVDQLETTQTTVLSLFMCLPGPEKPLQAFGQMEETARQVALDLGGELKDENLSVMTQQTLEHCRQRIRDYERKQLTIKLSS